ncbi:adenylate/guanylate cyclase domain-containing response regulator [Ramlibacter albus]|uniref:Response regulator n=1 Tax=Ramlibacter albus TaxID=2079448 RepID=A0A923MCZ0_9BURK|nr:adenylate/guanylate cyclase domain-containing response regulator [Ramlibacter albus]MBC5767261.1 response regulator [Ramlibacter albus]
MKPGRVLVVDDTPLNVKLLVDALGVAGYHVASASSGEEALASVAAQAPDIVLLDVMMPGMNGFEVCEKLRADPATALLPVVLVTALDGKDDRIRGIEAGADDFLTKPINKHELLARVKSLLRIKTLYDQVEAQRRELREWNATLEERVKQGMAELERMSHLKRFFSPAVANLILQGEVDPARSRRAEITVVFLDLRGFTAFTEGSDPEDVIGVLREYHGTMGRLIMKHEGTVEHFAGDGIMIFFNDPVPVPNPAERAVRMALEMHAEFARCAERWSKLGHQLGMGIGIAQGFATMGWIGFEGRMDFGAVGAVCSMAARLCSEAAAGQTLVQQRIVGRLEGLVRAESVGELQLKGFPRPVAAYDIRGIAAQAR